MIDHVVNGNGGVRLHVREWGVPEGPPILFIHGIAQCHLCWSAQAEGALARDFRLVAFDLRGHGMSEKPSAADHYTEPETWADDVAAVIDTLGLDQPVLVGWSLGAMIACDYLFHHGDDGVAGVNLVGGAVTLRLASGEQIIGPGLTDHLAGMRSPDLETRIDAIRAFLRDQTFEPMTKETFERAIGWNMAVPPEVRAGIGARTRFSDAALAKLRVPTLVSHGRDDKVALPRIAEYILESCPTARASWYDGTGHQPFLEQPHRFDRELAAFVRETRADTAQRQ